VEIILRRMLGLYQ